MLWNHFRRKSAPFETKADMLNGSPGVCCRLRSPVLGFQKHAAEILQLDAQLCGKRRTLYFN